MSNDIWVRPEVDSPCVKICVMHSEAQMCVGCLRTMDEIAAWSGLTPAERQAIMADLPGRAPRLAKRRGGRLGRLER